MLKRDGDKTKKKLKKLLMIKKNVLDSLTLLSKGDRANQKSPNNDAEIGQGFHSNSLDFGLNRRAITSPDYSKMATWGDRVNQGRHGIRGIRTEPDFQVDSGFYAGRRNTDHVVSKSNIMPDESTLAPVNTWPRAHFFLGCSENSEMPRTDAFTSAQIHGYPGGRYIPEGKFLPSRLDDSQKYSRYQGARAMPRSYWRSQRQNRDATMTNTSRPFTNPNADIIRYLNQFNDKSAFGLHAPYPSRHSFFTPSGPQDTCDRGHGHQSHEKIVDDFRGQKEFNNNNKSYDRIHKLENKAYNSHSDIANLTVPTQNNDCYDVIYTNPECSSRQYRTREHQQHQRVPYCTEQYATDDSGSIFSSDADSDFMFFPCSSLRQALKGLTLTDPCDPNTVSEIPAKVSWRSDLCGSSLDDVTEQFFLDEEALSDDVFMDEPSMEDEVFHESPVPATTVHSKPNRPAETRVMLGTQIEEPSDHEPESYCIGQMDTGYNTVTVATQTCETEAEYCPLYSPNISPKANTWLQKEDDFVSSGDETHTVINRELANTFDSLRRNSTQSKSRRLWKQRRDAKSKKIQDRNGRNSNINKSEPSNQNERLVKAEIFTFETEQAQRTVTQPAKKIPPPKPLRGILKNKTCKQSEIIESSVIQTKSSAERSNGRPLDRKGVVSMFCERSLENPETFFLANEGADFPPRTDVNFYNPQALAPAWESDLGLNELNTVSKTEEFYFLISPTDNVGNEFIAVRKNSLEMYKWTRSLQRRRQMKFRRELARVKNQVRDKNEENEKPKEKNIATI